MGLHSEENFKKREDCSITIDELIARIDNWNKKYGDIAQLVEHRVCSVHLPVLVKKCSSS